MILTTNNPFFDDKIGNIPVYPKELQISFHI